MRSIPPIALITIALAGSSGCATSSKRALLPRVGPVPEVSSPGRQEGALQVYTAREPAAVDANAREFFWNNDFGQNQFLRTVSHSDYLLYAANGRLLRRVSNNTGMNDPNPALLRLPPGDYQVRAEAEENPEVTLRVKVPVRIEPGLTTTVHLDGTGEPRTLAADDELVRLPNGRPVGWRTTALGAAVAR